MSMKVPGGQLCKVEREAQNMTCLCCATTNLTCLSPVDADEYATCLQQLLVNTVTNGSASSNVTIDRTDPAKAYGYGFLMVAATCLMSLIGVLLLPILKNNSKFHQVYPYANALLVALGASALVCSAILHFLPEVIQIEQKAFIWKGTVIIAGLYAFCLFEMFLHQYLNLDIHHDHGSSHDSSSYNDTSTESDIDEKNSIGNHSGDLASNNLLMDTNTVPLMQKELGNDREKSKLISDSKKVKWFSFSCRSIKPLAWTIIGGNIVHNFVDGMTLGAAISQRLSLGVSAAIPIAFHEVPHELGDFAILISAGFSWYMALLINFMLGTVSLVGLVLGVAVGTESHASIQWILTVSIGLFLYIALVDLLPTLIYINEKGRKLFFLTLMTNIGFFISFIIIIALDILKTD